MLPLAIAYIVALARFDAGLGDADAGHGLLPAARHEAAGPWRPEVAALDQDRATGHRSTGCWNTRGRCWRRARASALLAVATVPFFRQDVPAAVQRRLGGRGHAPQSRHYAGGDHPARPAGPRFCCSQVPEVEHVGRRSGRAELDEHAEGVHVSELDVALTRSARTTAEIFADMRRVLAPLPVALNIGQPISHRIDHMLSGVRSQIAIKIFGDDLDTLRSQAAALHERLARIPGVADLEIEKQVLTPQVKVRIDYERAAHYGVSPSRAAGRTADADRRRARHAGDRRQPALCPRAATARIGPLDRGPASA